MARVKKIKNKELDSTKNYNISNNNITNIVKSGFPYNKNGYIYINYIVFDDYAINNGQTRIRFSLGIKYSKRAMQRAERDVFALALEHHLKTNTFHDDINLTIDEFALESINEGYGNRSEDTQEDYINIYNNFIKPIFGNTYIDDLKVKEIIKWKNDIIKSLKLSKSRYDKYHRTFNIITKYAYINEYVNRNIMDLVDRKSNLFSKPIKGAKKYFTQDEMKRIIDGSDNLWFKTFIIFAFSTGCRSGEILAITWDSLDFNKQTIWIHQSIRKGKLKNSTKTNEDRTIRMSSYLKEALLYYRDNYTINSDYIFPSAKTNKPYTEPKAITNRFLKPLLKKLNIEYSTLYSSRHSWATSMIENNVTINFISGTLGHKKVGTTMDYYLKNDEFLKTPEDYENRLFA